MVQETADTVMGEISRLAEQVASARFMEVCGTHTMSLFRSGVRGMLPRHVRLLSGPGCPVCVTCQGYIDAACALARRGDVTVCTYGDMMRVPGAGGSLAEAHSEGGRVAVVYSARDALRMAMEDKGRSVVFLAVGFETTAPATALTVLEAAEAGAENFSVLCSHKLILPALRFLLDMDEVVIDGFLCPGHVSVVLGSAVYGEVAKQYGKACVVAGFEPMQLLLGIRGLLRQVVEGRATVENVYGAAVREHGNTQAQAVLERVFEVVDEPWRALGVLKESGLGLQAGYERYDAARRYGLVWGADAEPAGCRCGEVIQGKAEPTACKLFGTGCTPMRPIGPCMVSSEGTCAAWYKYGR